MKSRIDAIVVLFAVLLGLFLAMQVQPRVLVTDEVAYSLMAYSFAEEGTLEIWNGFDEFHSWELLLPSMELAMRLDGSEVRMYGIPAPLYTFLAYPFYKLWKLSGLFILNIASYSLMIILVYHTAKLFVEDEGAAALAALLCAFTTITLSFTGYVIPHLLSTALVLGASFLAFKGVSGGKGAHYFFLSGFVGGLSVGVRFTDGVFVLVLAALLLFRKDRRGLYAFLTGLAVPLLLIALIDYISYGDVFETGYGNPDVLK